MRVILLSLIFTLMCFTTFAQSDNGVHDAGDTATEEKQADKKTKKPDFNKKKISLDRLDEKKWSIRIGYAYFFPDNKYAEIFANKLKFGGAYEFNKYLQLQAFIQYAEGNKNYNIGGINTNISGTLYNLGGLVTGLYPMELSVGEIAPYGAIGGVYTFGNVYSTNSNGTSTENIQGGGILVQAGLQYSYHVFSIRAYGEYLVDFTPLTKTPVNTFSGFSAGVELGVKF